MRPHHGLRCMVLAGYMYLAAYKLVELVELQASEAPWSVVWGDKEARIGLFEETSWLTG